MATSRPVKLTRFVAPGLAATFAAAACSRGAAPQEPPGPGLGTVMVDVGRRFELYGRAGSSERFELAAFEASELGETFENDIPHAQLPKEGPTAHIPAASRAFAATNIPELKKAAENKDGRALASAFASAADACNACHAASGKAFIVVPRIPGRSVPEVERNAAPTPPAPTSSSH